MDKEKILNNHKYYSEKDTFFKRNQIKFELITLIFVGIGLFFLGFVILYSNIREGPVKENSNSQIINKLEDVNKVVEKEIKHAVDKTIESIEKKEDNNQTLPKEESNDIPQEEKTQFTIKDVLGTTIYSKELNFGEKITFNNVVAGGYFLADNTDKVLFTTTTSNNVVECTIANPLDSTICTVTEVEIPPTE